ncbi:MAG: patatin-like phospholipase family protein [Acetobacterales bacterium]
MASSPKSGDSSRRSQTAAKGAKGEAAPAAAAPEPPPVRRGEKPVNLGLQGGGAHGSFTWGVLDRLLEDGRIYFEGIVGTSAGAMNASVLASGLATGGREGARESLDAFWRKISEAAKKGPLQPTWLDKMLSVGNMDFSPGFLFMDSLSKMMSPYQLNPFNVNPLRDVLAEIVDFEALRKAKHPHLFISATNVLTGRLKVFQFEELSLDAVMASACLPFMFQAVEIDGNHYWDGGYMGNPPIYPLIYHTSVRDVLIVQINPVNIPDLPTSATAILDRINTLSFNSSLMREMRAIHFVSKLIDEDGLDPEKFRRILIHTIDAEDTMSSLGVSSKLNADMDFLLHMKGLGREAGETFLRNHFDKIGVESSTDIAAKFF